MAKRAGKLDDLTEALNDEKMLANLTNKIQDRLTYEVSTERQDKLTQELREAIESRFNELNSDFQKKIIEMQTKMMETLEKSVKEMLTKSTSAFNSQLAEQNDRLNVLETKYIQNEIVICGLGDKLPETKDDLETNQLKEMNMAPLMQLVLQQLKKDLSINIDIKDINFIYRMRKRDD